jgi:tetratricopeptide (TPR) repeat protein
MSSEVAELFARALELAGGERARFVAEVRARDPAIAAELDRLLAGDGEDDSPLDRSPWAEFERATEERAPLPSAIGPYRILRELGRGGMGRVYLAEEATADYTRMLALKVIDSPFADGDAVRRFREELRILAQLEHPGIARFVQGGRSPEGLWYLALEYVDGIDLLAWSTERGLDVEGRARLFLAALEPIAYAHGLGVVHRDLKPRHLLVDFDGRPRLLDFGISKLIEPGDAFGMTGAAATRTGSRALTPAYASPEQFRGEAVTPASDVFSLGVILFELLAGSRPFARATTQHELERQVLETDTERPSLVARRREDGGDTRRARSVRAAALDRDLDEICLRALRKLPAERYAGAGELADDLRRALAGEPVAARRGGRRYRAARFVARHRTRLALAGALGVALIAGLFALDARRDALPQPAPEPLAAPSFLLRPAPPSAEVERELARRPGDLAQAATLVRALIREGRTAEAEVAIGRLRQLPGAAADPVADYVDGLIATAKGETQRALASTTRGLERALASGRGDLVPMLRLGRARSLSDLGRAEESLAETRIARREAGRAGDDVATAVALNDLAVSALASGRFAAGEKLLALALPVARRAGDDSRLAFVVFNLGTVAHLRGRPDVGEERVREAIALFEKVGNRRRVAISRVALAEILWDRGATGEARALLDAALAVLREVEDHFSIAAALALRARLDLESGDLTAADRALAPIEQSAQASGTPARLMLTADLRGRIAAARGRFDEALRALDEARRLAEEFGDTESVVDETLTAARLELGRHRVERAAQRLAALGTAGAGGADTNPRFAAALLHARIALAQGGVAAARGRIDELGDGAGSPSLERRLGFLPVRAALLAAEGRLDAARSDLEAGIVAATSAGRLVTGLDLQLALAALDLESGDPGRARAAAAEIAERSASLGLTALAQAANDLRGGTSRKSSQ